MANTKSRRELHEHVTLLDVTNGHELLRDERHRTRDEHQSAGRHAHDAFPDEPRS